VIPRKEVPLETWNWITRVWSGIGAQDEFTRRQSHLLYCTEYAD